MKTREEIHKEGGSGEVWHMLKAILEVALDIRDELTKKKKTNKK